MYRGHSLSDPGPITASVHRHRATGVPMKLPPLQLPRELQRPPFDFDRARLAIDSADPSLEDVPIPFIRHTLRARYPEMMNGRNLLAPSHLPKQLPVTRLPDSLEIPLLPSQGPASFPTHALAVYSPKSTTNQAMIFPIHGVVFVTHCSIRLSPDYAPNPHAVCLPILKLPLPSPAAFMVLYEYMYTQRLDHVLMKLLPIPVDFLEGLTHNAVVEARKSRSTIQRLGACLCQHEHGNFQALMTHASRVKDLWQTMVTLRLYTIDMWDALDLAWDVILSSFNVASGRRG